MTPYTVWKYSRKELEDIKEELELIFNQFSPAALQFLREKCVEGTINGSFYLQHRPSESTCGCLKGWLCFFNNPVDLPENGTFYWDSEDINYLFDKTGIDVQANEAAIEELFIMEIKKGDTPENSRYSAWLLGVIDTHLESRKET